MGNKGNLESLANQVNLKELVKMPVYEYYCFSCDSTQEEYKNITEHNLPSKCEKCQKEVHRIVSKLSNPDISGYPYFDKCLDREITSAGHRKSVLKQENLVEAG